MSGLGLSAAQKAAVLYVSTPTIVSAGAGSGKTRTLTSKIAHLVNHLGYDPARILAITFTNKAANEMKGRLSIATGKPIEEFPWVRTFHSACFRMLKEHCELLGYRKPISIHDSSQQKTHLKRALAELDLDLKYLNAASAVISHAKNSGDPAAYMKVHCKIPRKLDLYRLYAESLSRNNSVDFDDILMLTRDLLKKFPEIRNRYREAFDYILVDEFQDSNDIQNQIVDLLLKDGNLTVVGDDYQSIYKFRGADPFHFINFPKKYADARIFKLEENYRSTSQIVAASDALIAQNAQRIEKQCFSSRQGDKIQVNEFADEAAEAEWVARKCREYVNYKKVPFDEIAVLFRTKFTSLPFERAMRSAAVPYTMVGAQGFFQRREVQDINAYLLSAVNVSDDVSFERILNVPRRGIGSSAMKKVIANKVRNMSLQEACRITVRQKILPKKTSAALEELLNLLSSLKTCAPDVAMKRVVAETGYEDYIRTFAENNEDFDARRENIGQMIFDAAQKATIPDYLEDAALIREDQDNADDKNGIRLSTIHAAKGLEFKIVFVVALEEHVLPHRRSFSSENEEENDAGIEEERRLMYVAMTRAADCLHLTSAMRRRGEYSVPSRFLGEIPEDLMETHRYWDL
jgi:DNA helicase-2/ATP-dependent DNA helicase PcrA